MRRCCELYKAQWQQHAWAGERLQMRSGPGVHVAPANQHRKSARAKSQRPARARARRPRVASQPSSQRQPRAGRASPNTRTGERGPAAAGAPRPQRRGRRARRGRRGPIKCSRKRPAHPWTLAGPALRPRQQAARGPARESWAGRVRPQPKPPARGPRRAARGVIRACCALAPCPPIPASCRPRRRACRPGSAARCQSSSPGGTPEKQGAGAWQDTSW